MKKGCFYIFVFLLISFSGFSQVPVANFSASSDTICAKDSIQFTDQTTNAPTSWLWSANPSTGVSFNTPTSQNPSATFTSAGTYSVVLIAANGSGSDSDTMVVTILPLPNVIATTPVTVCSGNSVTLNASGATNYVWNTSQFLSDSLVANPVCTPGSSINYTVTGTTVLGCSDTAVVNVIANPSAVASGTAGTAPFGIPASIAFTSTSTGQDSVVWNFGDGSATDTTTNPSHMYNVAGTNTVTLIAYNANGCNDTTNFVVTVQDKSSLIVPNFFTPNYDDVNDVFRPISTGIKDFYCAIYDRWGLLMFEWDRYNGWWDGHTTSGEPCGAGVYFYVMRATGSDGKEFKQSGYVHLFR